MGATRKEPSDPGNVCLPWEYRNARVISMQVRVRAAVSPNKFKTKA